MNIFSQVIFKNVLKLLSGLEYSAFHIGWLTTTNHQIFFM